MVAAPRNFASPHLIAFQLPRAQETTCEVIYSARLGTARITVRARVAN
jgi:hypothetical protein